jgi:UDP-N-acetylmuramoyl-L-alanyl-D-glutamate--2,6-diaminopimelate ligase
MSGTAHTISDIGLLDEGRIIGVPPDVNAQVAGITADSRVVDEGTVFVAIKGAKLDGAEFIQYAVRQRALAIVTTLEGAVTALETIGHVPNIPMILVDDPRATLSRLAARFHPRQPKAVAAVTGTSGKTSVAEFLRQIWERLGIEAASLGTMGVASSAVSLPGGLTTPDPVGLHATLEKLADAGVAALAMEASSHGLDQYRLDGVRVQSAAITNIARDHMDYHPTTAHYTAAKLRLFTDLLVDDGTVVANADDAVFPMVSAIAKMRGLRLIPVGQAGEGGFTIRDTVFTDAGQRVDVAWNGQSHILDLPLIGSFQARNVLTAAALAIGCGADAAAVLAVLPTLEGVRGRMELVARRANDAPVFVDYAHKPDALTAALSGLRPHVSGRLHVVFGAGGDRDAGKRPLMGEAAAQGADVVIVTDDNPRSEDPAAIRAAILAACPDSVEIPDRAEAILRGIDGLEEGDALLIAGKGHETGQVVAGDVIPFDDAEHARIAVAALDGDEDDIARLLGGDP